MFNTGIVKFVKRGRGAEKDAEGKSIPRYVEVPNCVTEWPESADLSEILSLFGNDASKLYSLVKTFYNESVRREFTGDTGEEQDEVDLLLADHQDFVTSEGLSDPKKLGSWKRELTTTLKKLASAGIEISKQELVNKIVAKWQAAQ